MEQQAEQDAAGKHSYRNRIKKKKRKFIANVKGFGKRGNFGRGTHLESDEWSYYINIMDSIKSGYDSLEDKQSMAENVLEQTKGKEIHTSSNQVACTVIEHLLPFVDADNFERFQSEFANSFRPICADKFASHILEKLVSISFLRGVAKIQTDDKIDVDQSTTSSKPLAKKMKTCIPDEKEFNLDKNAFSDEHRQKCREYVVKVSKFLLNNLEDYVWDTYGSHIMRTCFDSLSGVFAIKKSFLSPANEQPQQPRDSQLEINYQVPDEWLEILQEYALRLQNWPQFPDFPYNELSSSLIQSLCVALARRDKNTLKHLGKRILNEAFLPPPTAESKSNEPNEDDKIESKDISIADTSEIDTNLPSVFTSESSIFCLEALINVAGTKLLTQIYVKLFSGRLARLSLMKSANFAVQKLLAKIKVKEDFEAIYDELGDSIENLLQIGHTGVVSALAQACLRLALKQGPFMQQFQTALDCLSPKVKSDKFALVTLKLKPYNVVIQDTSNFVHIHGALILQSMLKFNKPIKLVQCLLDMKNTDLAEIFCSPKGSHVVDAFMDSSFIGEKSRERLVKHMMDCYLNMAISKHGSWVVEKLFNAAGDQQKARIVKELAEKVNQLNGTPSGRLLNHKFRIDTYRLSPDQWRATFNKESKAEKMFKDIL